MCDVLTGSASSETPQPLVARGAPAGLSGRLVVPQDDQGRVHKPDRLQDNIDSGYAGEIYD
jgi:hypothetical protein